MSHLDRFKDIEIDKQKYQIGKFTAKTGMFIATQIFTKIAPFGLDQQIDLKNLPSDRPLMTEQDFSDIVDYCMCASKKYEAVGSNDVPLPIMMQKGKWLVPDLEYDMTTVIALCAHVLSFNISVFFKDGALETLKNSLADISLFHIQR